MRRIRKLLCHGAWALGSAVAAQPANIGALNPPSPLVQGVLGQPPGAAAADLTTAQRAQDLGLPSIAADIYRQMREVPGADRAGLTLALATALLDAGRAEEAAQALAEIPEPHSSAWHLRAGLAAAQLKKIEVARAEFAAIREPDISVEDYPWYWFFQGELVDLGSLGSREVSRANDFYRRAEGVALTPLSKARFQLAAERVRLRTNEQKEENLKSIRENYQQNQSTPVGYNFAEIYAMSLDAAGQQAEAEKFLQELLARVPRQEGALWDKFRLILGMIGDKSRPAARTALNQLLESGNTPERQRQALQLLAENSRRDPERGGFRALLNRLIDAKPDHPIKESLLLVRAQTALADKNYIQAEVDATALLTQFPLSKLKVYAYGLQTQSAWEQGRFRQAADNARKARAELQPADPAVNPAAVISSRARAELGVLEAEARFRTGLEAGDAGDFRLAADAYAAVLRERSPELDAKKIGDLMLQRAIAEIKSGSPEAGKVIDELARDPAFGLENRWQAEWSLARALQLRGEAGVKEAFARVSALLRESIPAGSDLKPQLRARMEWLQMRLAFDNGDYEQTIKLADTLLAAPRDVEGWLKTEIASTAVLLKARAQFALNREAEALKTLEFLRFKYPKSDAEMLSYLDESAHYELQEKIDEARNWLIKLTDNPDPEYKKSPYVPWALYRLAELSERLGREENLKEANRAIEDLIELVNKRETDAQADLYFAARKKQGDLFRKLNQFPQAQQAYEDLINKFPRRPDVVYAQLALAECLNARATSEPSDRSHAEKAQLIFEQLRDRVDAPDDVRVEAGYNLGRLMERSGRPEEAVKVWFQDVIKPFLVDETKQFERDAKRPWWLARTLRELGEIEEKLGRIDDAIAAYKLILDKNLPYRAVAAARLEQLGRLPAKTVP